jgi:hypothetical protein
MHWDSMTMSWMSKSTISGAKLTPVPTAPSFAPSAASATPNRRLPLFLLTSPLALVAPCLRAAPLPVFLGLSRTSEAVRQHNRTSPHPFAADLLRRGPVFDNAANPGSSCRRILFLR